jgi:hypothetical protein
MSVYVLIPTTVATTAGVSGVAIAPGIVDTCKLHNTSATDVTVNLHIIRNGAGSASVSNRFGVVVIPTLGTSYGPHVVGAALDTGDSIAVVPSVDSVLNVYVGMRQQ